jgi:hypothetical protein
MQDARTALRALTLAALAKLSNKGTPIAEMRGVAFYDQQKDSFFTKLPEFNLAQQTVVALARFVDRFGSTEGWRIVLQFQYRILSLLDEPMFQEEVFDDTWDALQRELSDPIWTYRGIANVRFYESTQDHALGDGVTIVGRNMAALSAIGLASILPYLSADWSGFGASSYVMLVEHQVAKTPENLLLMDLTHVWTKAQRAIGALRLLSSGEISIGSMWVTRPSSFNVGIGGGHQVGFGRLRDGPRGRDRHRFGNHVQTRFSCCFTPS